MKRIINDHINLTGKKPINHGCAGVVFDLGNGTCYKRIYNEEYTNIKDKGNILRTIKNLRLSNFCRIEEIVYDNEGYVIGYLMPIYKEDGLDVLASSKDYILDSYRNIYNGVLTLSENGIFMNDFDSHNTFITNDGVIIYDFDMYLMIDRIDYLRIRNVAQLNILFNQIFKNEVLYKHSMYDPRLIDKNIDSLFGARTNPELLDDTLSKYQSPIEYLKVRH